MACRSVRGNGARYFLKKPMMSSRITAPIIAARMPPIRVIVIVNIGTQPARIAMRPPLLDWGDHIL